VFLHWNWFLQHLLLCPAAQCQHKSRLLQLSAAGAPKMTTDKLQRVMNAAARVVTNTQKFDHGLLHVQHQDLHWLDVTDSIKYQLHINVYMAWHHKTCLISVHQSRKFWNDDIFSADHLCGAYTKVQGSNWQPSEDIHSPALHHPHGTLYQTHSLQCFVFISFSETAENFGFFPSTHVRSRW